MVLKLLLFSAIVQILSAENLECAVNKFRSRCLCKAETSHHTNLPTYIADCTGLLLGSFPNTSSLYEDLHSLDLSLNDIERLDSTQNSDIVQKSLRKLVMQHNKITTIEDHFFDNFENLMYLDLSYNNISNIGNADIFKNIKDLQNLFLSFNNIKTLPSGIFEPMKIPIHIDLSSNPLGSFLTQSSDVLSKILGIQENISHLGLNSVGLEDVNANYFGYMKQLQFLEIADNNFKVIPSVPYSIEHMDLSGNNLSYISARYLNYHSLKYLKISRMSSLVSIHHYAFYNLQSINQLIITDCPNLDEFTDLAFGEPSKTTQAFPKHLSLARNGLTSLNSSYKHLFRKMDHVDLTDNPWNCECEILWMLEFNRELFANKNIRCATPPYLKNKSVMELTHSDLQHCFPEIYGKTSHRVLIVILTAAVLFLLGFVFYLVKYPQSWLHSKQFGVVGPNSPYSPTPTTEEG